MPTFSNTPIPRDGSPERETSRPSFSNSPIPNDEPTGAAVPAADGTSVASASAETLPDADKVSTADGEIPAADGTAVASASAETLPDADKVSTADGEIPAAETSETHEPASESVAENGGGTPAPDAPPAAPAPAPTFHTPPGDAVIIRHFSHAQPEAIEKLNADFGLSLNRHSFNRLQKLFRDTIKRDPTAGELRLLDALDRAGRGQPDREAVGELYTDSPAIAEAWADMMVKHAALYESEGLSRTGHRPPPPCSFQDAVTLMERYLYRTGQVSPITDGLPFGGKNSDGRTAVLAEAWQEAEAIAQGYSPVASAEMEGVTRSVWVRKGPAPTEIPEKAGDFLVYLPAAAPAAVMALVAGEMKKSNPDLGAVRAVSTRSVLATILSLCEGVDIFADRLREAVPEDQQGRLDVAPLCDRPILSHGGKADYILRVPVKKVRTLSDTLRALSMRAVAIGQLKGGSKVSVKIRSANRDVPVAEMDARVLREYPLTGLYRRRAEASADSVGVLPSAPALWCVPEAGLLMTAVKAEITAVGQGFPTVTDAVKTVVSPLMSKGIPPRGIRLSVTLTSADGEYAPGDLTVEALCGLHRAAAELGIPPEDPAVTVTPLATGDTPKVTLTLAAWAPSPLSLTGR